MSMAYAILHETHAYADILKSHICCRWYWNALIVHFHIPNKKGMDLLSHFNVTYIDFLKSVQNPVI
ncbi:hypothetical protein ACJIZ3_006353 [Penstemon smallii]|uniref:Uncharacterized protein n=1 Tax=Penstemon smallii TaxID=265156 RepID=A0ABD3S7I6_9LAMI